MKNWIIALAIGLPMMFAVESAKAEPTCLPSVDAYVEMYDNAPPSGVPFQSEVFTGESLNNLKLILSVVGVVVPQDTTTALSFQMEGKPVVQYLFLDQNNCAIAQAKLPLFEHNAQNM